VSWTLLPKIKIQILQNYVLPEEGELESQSVSVWKMVSKNSIIIVWFILCLYGSHLWAMMMKNTDFWTDCLGGASLFTPHVKACHQIQRKWRSQVSETRRFSCQKVRICNFTKFFFFLIKLKPCLFFLYIKSPTSYHWK